MGLKITKSTDIIEVKTLCVTIYSNPGMGKTSLSFTAKNPLLLDFDGGAYRATNRKDVVLIDDWSDVAGMSADDIAPYDTIIVDTAGKALDKLAADIIKRNPKLGYGGALNQQGWGQLGTRFSAFLKLLSSFGKDVVLISHMDEKSDGEATKERLKVQGGSKDLILTDSDTIARISIYNKERRLIFSPTETAFGKDPARIGDVAIPDFESPKFDTFLGDLIEQIKGSLNALTEGQMEMVAEMDWFKSQLPEMFTADEINSVLGRAKKGGRAISALVVDRAKVLGFDFDPEVKEYIEPATEADDAQDGGENE